MFSNKHQAIKSNKKSYFSYNAWRQTYLVKMNKVHLNSVKRFYATSSSIPKTYLNTEVLIYNGKSFYPRLVNKYNIGVKSGTLVWFKKPALLRKKK